MDPKNCLKLFIPARMAALLLLPVCLLGMAGRAFAQTYVCGAASGEWTEANSPYILTCDVLVANLRIGPGVTVCASNFTFEVAGVLTALGTEAKPIVFKACNPAVGWQGILFNYSSPGSEMRYCIISNAVNSGVRITDSLPYLEHCTIANNTSASSSGGGLLIDIDQGDLTLRFCTIADNSARYYGGGLWAAMSTNTLILECCEIRGNAANPGQSYGDYYAGGIGVVGGLRVKNCLVISNTVYGNAEQWATRYADGGGLYSEGRAEVSNSEVRGNVARALGPQGLNVAYACGGGMMASGGGPMVVTNSILSHNTSFGDDGSYGGGMYINSPVGSPGVANCTFAYNNIEGLNTSASSATVMNSILFFNASGGTQLTGTTNVTYCDVQGGFPGEGNINFSPIFASQTNLMIVLGSRCIDAGNPATLYNDLCFPPCGPSLGSVTNDMGAHGGPGACRWATPCLPAIVTPPRDQKGCLAHSATFTVSASGNAPLSYQWYFSPNIPIANATNTSLNLTGLQGTNAGPYFVVVSNPYGNVTSTMAQLTIYDPYTELEVEWYFDAYIGAGLYIAGQPGATYVFKYTSDLRNTNWATWTPLATNRMDSSGWFFYLDEESPYSPMRFYQARRKP
jgi:hypothetical protein